MWALRGVYRGMTRIEDTQPGIGALSTRQKATSLVRALDWLAVFLVGLNLAANILDYFVPLSELLKSAWPTTPQGDEVAALIIVALLMVMALPWLMVRLVYFAKRRADRVGLLLLCAVCFWVVSKLTGLPFGGIFGAAVLTWFVATYDSATVDGRATLTTPTH
jgi:hypothetical protein